MFSNRTTENGRKMTGCFYGIGVGPGDPELITRKAWRILSQVPVIFVPRKAEQSEGMARSIIDSLKPPIESKIVGLHLPMLRNRKRLEEHWQQAADTIWQHLGKGEDCAFVNVGDPLLYGSFVHVLDTLRQGHPEIEVEVVPGVSSINAAAARAIVPLGTDDDHIAIIADGFDDKILKKTLEEFDTVIFLKVNNVFDKLVRILEELDLTDKCVYVRRSTAPGEEIIRDISRLKGRKIDYFSLLIVRK
jgi:precorrin-2/cobalt-factor-2 C20-methyltransferase